MVGCRLHQQGWNPLLHSQLHLNKYYNMYQIIPHKKCQFHNNWYLQYIYYTCWHVDIIDDVCLLVTMVNVFCSLALILECPKSSVDHVMALGKLGVVDFKWIVSTFSRSCKINTWHKNMSKIILLNLIALLLKNHYFCLRVRSHCLSDSVSDSDAFLSDSCAR